MKKITILFLMTLLSTLTASAYDAKIDGIYYNLITKAKQAEVTYGDVSYTMNRLYRVGHPFTVKQYLGALASLSQITSVLCVDNESQAFQLVKSLFEKCTDGKNRMVKTPVREKRRKRGKHHNKMVAILSLVGDINSTRAEKLIDELGVKTLDDLVNLEVDDIMSVKGFGKKTANNIVRYLR